MTGNPDIIPQLAGIAQLVEQLLRKQLVGGSSPLSGTTNTLIIKKLFLRQQSHYDPNRSWCNPGATSFQTAMIFVDHSSLMRAQ